MNSTEQTVAVQKAIGATKALVSIANGAPWSVYQQLETDTRGIVTERMAQAILDALQQSPAAPPPADSEDRQLATIARRIAKRIELHNLPISGDTHFSFIHGSTRYVGDLHAPHPAPLMEALRQLALWKAGQQVAGAAEAAPVDAPVDALATAQERIAELEAERDSAVREGAEKASSPLYDKYESVPNLASQIGQFFDEAGGVNYVEIKMIAQDGRTFTLNIQRNEGKTPHQIITELKAEVRLLQEERDNAVRDADKRALLLREIEFYTDPKRRLDGQALSDKLDSIHARIVYVTASLSVPESEATDGA